MDFLYKIIFYSVFIELYLDKVPYIPVNLTTIILNGHLSNKNALKCKQD